MTRVAATDGPVGRSVRLCLSLLVGLAATAAQAAAPALRVGTSGDYAPFSIDPAGPAPLDGLDVALASAFAAAHGGPLEFVRFSWPELERRLAAGDFDVAMSGVTVRPERSLVGRFTAPVAESGALVLVRDGGAVLPLDALDRAGVTLAVNAGGYLERAARARFPAATVNALADNVAVLDELLAGRADGAVTDTLEAPAWQERAPGLAPIGPFTHDRKAWLVRADAPELAAELDAWLAAKEADGTLASLRARWIPSAAQAPTASPALALIAAIDERLALMVFVAEAKRAAGKPVRDPAQEARVLEAASGEVRAAAQRAGRSAPSEACVGALFRAQIDAGSAIQEATLAGPPRGPAPAPDLETVTRPALARIAPRIAAALVALPAGMDADALRRAVREGLRTPALGDEERAALEAAVVRCAEGAGS
jgi:cyclohexadienyl dehydratase